MPKAMKNEFTINHQQMAAHNTLLSQKQKCLTKPNKSYLIKDNQILQIL